MLSFKDSSFEIIERNENPALINDLPHILSDQLKTNNINIENILNDENHVVVGNFNESSQYSWKYIKIYSTDNLEYISNKVRTYYDSSYFLVKKDLNTYDCFWATRSDPLDKKNVSLFLSGMIIGLIVYNYIPNDKQAVKKILNFDMDEGMNINDVHKNISFIYDKISLFNKTFSKEKGAD
jgi:hypothetical protein